MKNLFVVLLFAISQPLLAQNVEAVVDKFTEATGGKEKWSGVSRYTLQQSFVANASTDYDAEVNVDATSQSISRKKTIMKRDFYYIVNKQSGWLKIPMGSLDQNVKYTVKDLSTQEKTSMKEEINDKLFPFMNYATKGYTATYGGEENLNGKPAQKIVLKKAGVTKSYWFDKADGLLVKEVIETPADTETWEHKEYTSTASGIKFPTKSTFVSNKYKKLNKVSSSLVVNPEINPTVFSKE